MRHMTPVDEAQTRIVDVVDEPVEVNEYVVKHLRRYDRARGEVEPLLRIVDDVFCDRQR
jgi:hypothetical protein